MKSTARRTAGRRMFFGSFDGHVYGLAAASGEERRRYDTGAPVVSSPLIHAGRVGRWEELSNGQWRLWCRSAFRTASPEAILSDLERLADGAGWKAAWEALFSWPESPC